MAERDDWLTVARTFASRWEEVPTALAAFVCGSYVTGEADEFSDIDITVVLADSAPRNERGTVAMGGYLVEYFASRCDFLAKEFACDAQAHDMQSFSRVLNSLVLFDTGGYVERLRQAAVEILDRADWRCADDERGELLYSLWDSMDTLSSAQSCGNDGEFDFIYHNSLRGMVSVFLHYLGKPKIQPQHVYSSLAECKNDRIYGLGPIDPAFRQRLSTAIEAGDRKLKMRSARDLYEYMTSQMGGFCINGWKAYY